MEGQLEIEALAAIANSRIERDSVRNGQPGPVNHVAPPLWDFLNLLFISRVFASSIQSIRSIRSPRWPDPRRPRVPPFFASLYTYTSLIITLCYPRASAPPPTPRLVLLSPFLLLLFPRFLPPTPIQAFRDFGKLTRNTFSRPCTSRAFVDPDFLSLLVAISLHCLSPLRADTLPPSSER